MTNRERARAWLLDTYPSEWEAEHVDALTGLLNEVSRAGREDERARLRNVTHKAVQHRQKAEDDGAARIAYEHCASQELFNCPECEHPLSMHVLGYGCGVEVEEGAVLSLCKCEKYQ